MTPFRNDDGNPFARETPWPKMPQAPMRLTGLPKTPPPQRVAPPVAPPVAPGITPASPVRGFDAQAHSLALPQVIARRPPVAEAAPDPEPQPQPQPQPQPEIAVPLVAPIAPRPPRRAGPRLTPLVAAGAVLAGGVGALVLMIGLRPPPAPSAPPQASPGGLAVGELIGHEAPRPAAAPIAAPPPLIAPPPNPAPVRTATLAPPRQPPRAARAAAPQPAATDPAPARIDLPPQPAPAPPTAPEKPFVRPAAPNPDAPFSSHVPDPG